MKAVTAYICKEKNDVFADLRKFQFGKITVSANRKAEKIYGPLCICEFAEGLSPQTIIEPANSKSQKIYMVRKS
jgi:hypothetical protein